MTISFAIRITINSPNLLHFFLGLFIFLAFAVSGRALALYKSKLPGIMTKKPPVLKRNQMASNCTLQSTCNVACDYQDNRDTYL